MPIYEYACMDCNTEFEILASPAAHVMPVCPECHYDNVKRCISLVGYRHADHWQQEHMSAMRRSQERDEIKKEAQKKAQEMAS